jgi:hypothetical protein
MLHSNELSASISLNRLGPCFGPLSLGNRSLFKYPCTATQQRPVLSVEQESFHWVLYKRRWLPRLILKECDKGTIISRRMCLLVTSLG